MAEAEEEVGSVLGNNDIDDVRWLCSLTHSELDVLIGLKKLVLLRAEKIGRIYLANDFDLKMLRRLSFALANELKEQLKGLPCASDFHSNLLNEEPAGGFGSTSVEDLFPYICSDSKMKIANMFFKDSMPTLEPITKGKGKSRKKMRSL